MPNRAPLVPEISSGAIHMVLDDFGLLGRAWREMDDDKTGERDVVHQILGGEYKRPLRVVAFDLEEGWVRDVTEDIARRVIETARENGGTLSREAADFVERVTGEAVPSGLLTTV